MGHHLERVDRPHRGHQVVGVLVAAVPAHRGEARVHEQRFHAGLVVDQLVVADACPPPPGHVGTDPQPGPPLRPHTIQLIRVEPELTLGGEAAVGDVHGGVAQDLQLTAPAGGFGLSGARVEAGEGVVVAHVGRVEDDQHLLATGQSGAGVGGQHPPVGLGVGHVQTGVVAGAQRLHRDASGGRTSMPVIPMPKSKWMRPWTWMLRCVFRHRGRLPGALMINSRRR